MHEWKDMHEAAKRRLEDAAKARADGPHRKHSKRHVSLGDDPEEKEEVNLTYGTGVFKNCE